MTSNLILSNAQMAQKYQELHEQNYKYPYFYKISKDKQYLYSLGFQHSNDSQNPEFNRLKKCWREFLREVDPEKARVMTEGGLRPVEKNEKVAIAKYGEAGLMAYLADKAGIKVVSPEPPQEKELKGLLREFSKEKIMYYYFAREIMQWHRLQTRASLREYVQKYLDGYAKRTGWKDFNFSFQHLVKLHDKFHDHVFDLENLKCFYDDSNPNHSRVASTSGFIRDKHIFSEIKKIWKKGSSIFIVYGSGHAIKLEPALKASLLSA